MSEEQTAPTELSPNQPEQPVTPEQPAAKEPPDTPLAPEAVSAVDTPLPENPPEENLPVEKPPLALPSLAWQKLKRPVEALPPETKAEPAGELPSGLQKWLGGEQPVVPPSVLSPQWCCYEQEEGQFPRVRIFGELNSLVQHLRKLEGREITVGIIHGRPAWITNHRDWNGQRYLILPGAESAVPIRRSKSGELPKLPVDPAEVQEGFITVGHDRVTIQSEGWLGDLSLLEPCPRSEDTPVSPAEDHDEDNNEQDDPVPHR